MPPRVFDDMIQMDSHEKVKVFMLQDRFASYLKPTPPRSLPRLNLFLDFMTYKTNDAIFRSSHTTPNGYGSRLLVEIIKLAGLKQNIFSPTTALNTSQYLVAIVRDLEKMIDVRIGKHTTKTLFIKSRTNCFELIIPVRRSDAITSIPFDKPYTDPQWRDIKPLRLVDLGASDLHFQVYDDHLTFYRRGPTHAVYTLDCVALVAKFIAYYKQQTSVDDPDQCILDFIHNDVIVPCLLNDALALWLRNTYRQQFISSSPLVSLTSTLWDTVNMDSIGADFSCDMVDVNHLKTDLIKKSLTDQTVFSSLLLTTRRQSFTDYFIDLQLTTRVSTSQQYIWIDCLKNLAWWEMMILVASLNTDNPDTLSLFRNVRRDLRYWVMMKPWTSISQSIPYHNTIRQRLEGLYEFTNLF